MHAYQAWQVTYFRAVINCKKAAAYTKTQPFTHGAPNSEQRQCNIGISQS